MPEIDVPIPRDSTSFDGIEDFSESICALCESGGDMICCDGKCLRSFHPSCIGLREEDIPEDSPFVCSDCVNGIQRCFQCKHFGIAKQLIKCRVPFCGKYYHADCVSSTDYDNYQCRLHICDDCGDAAVSKHQMRSLWRCFRCPKAYDAKHRPRDVHVIADNLFLCIRHIQNDDNSSLPEMSHEVKKYLAEKHSARRKQKSVKYISKEELLNSSKILVSNKLPTSNNSNSDINKQGFMPLQRMSTVKAVHRESDTGDNSSSNNSINPISTSLGLNIVPRKRRPETPSVTPDDHDNNISMRDSSDDRVSSAQYPSHYEHYPKKQRYVRPSSSPAMVSSLRRHNEMRRQNRRQWQCLANDDLYNDQCYSSMQYYSPCTSSNVAMSRTAALLSGFCVYGDEYDMTSSSEQYYSQSNTHYDPYYGNRDDVIDVRDLPSYSAPPGVQEYSSGTAPPVLSRTVRLLASVSATTASIASSGILSRTEQLLATISDPPSNSTGYTDRVITTSGEHSTHKKVPHIKMNQADASINKAQTSTVISKQQKDNKMSALDLMAMLQANKLISLPSKK